MATFRTFCLFVNTRIALEAHCDGGFVAIPKCCIVRSLGIWVFWPPFYYFYFVWFGCLSVLTLLISKWLYGFALKYVAPNSPAFSSIGFSGFPPASFKLPLKPLFAGISNKFCAWMKIALNSVRLKACFWHCSEVF